MELYPLKLSYTASHAVWGGNKLAAEWGKKTENGENIAETWELSVRNDGFMSRIENGSDKGLTLEEYIKKHGTSVVSERYGGGRFPLLIKFIDAADRLSVQVHPNGEYAGKYENDSGKNEMWYIISAENDAEIIYGFEEGYGKADLAEVKESGEYEKLLKRVKVRAGESYFIPAGLPHSIGAGILLAEIQENSDLTYRLYDYGRPRELHTEKAIAAAKDISGAEAVNAGFSKGKYREDCLSNNEYFCVLHPDIRNGTTFHADNAFHAVLSLDGDAVIRKRGTEYRITRGECWFIPAGLGEYHIKGEGDVLLASTDPIT